MALYDEEELDPAAAAAAAKDDLPPGMVDQLAQDDVLRNYFKRQRGQYMGDLGRAEDTASQNRYMARIGGALNTLGSSLGGQKVDNAAFEQLATDADRPLATLERRRKVEESGDKTVSNYIAQKYKIGQNAAKLKQTEDTQKETERHNRATEANAKAGLETKLPTDEKVLVDKLSTDRANRISIAGLIQENLADWEKLSDDQKLSRGRSMIKAMNSVLGSDAVGAEESRRLGEKLEFAWGNFTTDNPSRFGRDLDGFKKQALGTINVLKRSGDKNAEEVQKITGRPSRIGKQAGPQGKAKGQHLPGELVKVKQKDGSVKTMRVADDGDTLDEVGFASK